MVCGMTTPQTSPLVSVTLTAEVAVDMDIDGVRVGLMTGPGLVEIPAQMAALLTRQGLVASPAQESTDEGLTTPEEQE